MPASRIENAPALSHPAGTELLGDPSRRRAIPVVAKPMFRPMFPLNPWTTQPRVVKARS